MLVNMPGRPELRLSLPIAPVAGSSSSPSWKSQRFGDLNEGRVPANIKVKRWDGAARSSANWDNLRRDPELWFRGGNCFVHLYGKGQSRRGPAFKVPFCDVLSAGCHPLVQRFLARDVPETSGLRFDAPENFGRWSEDNPSARVDLYIPAPPTADRNQAFFYHLATRNLFAWIYRRSLVGVDLGSSLIGLLNSMSEFRNDDADHVADLLDYLDEEGYLDVRTQPIHALAILRLAESFKLRNLYIHAFCHCAGMNESLYHSNEYDCLSASSRKLIRRKRIEMDLNLGRAGIMLKTFLEDELSESHLGLPSGGRAHLERFRSFIQSFYANKLGYYPPASIDNRSTIFEPEVYRTMHADFEALHDFLVDTRFTTSDTPPALARGGVCTLQSVQDFDQRNRYDPLEHPLPLLPEMPTAPATKRLTWLSRGRQSKPDQRLVSHTALLKASNHAKPGLLQNDLVRAYRRFEEQSITSPAKVDRQNRISLVDARKVRWILVYSVYQVLRHCALIPKEVEDAKVDYHLAVKATDLPPWKDEESLQDLTRCQTAMVAGTPEPLSAFTSSASSLQATPRQLSPTIEIKPDIDYFAMTHREEPPPAPGNMRRSFSMRALSSEVPSRTRSLSASLSRKGTMRRSMSLLKNLQRTPEEFPSTPIPRNSSYHEIVVHGYGNGTNEVQDAEPAAPVTAWGSPIMPSSSAACGANRALSTSSSASSTKSSVASNGSTADTADSSAPPTSPKAPRSLSASIELGQATGSTTACPPVPPKSSFRRRQVMSMIIPPRASSSFSSRRTMSTSTGFGPNSYASEYLDLMQEDADYEPVRMVPSPLEIRKSFKNPFGPDCLTALPEDADAWESYHPGSGAVSPVDYDSDDDDIRPMWEQFNDLGGLTAPAPVATGVRS